jgi:hypothetical protein
MAVGSIRRRRRLKMHDRFGQSFDRSILLQALNRPQRTACCRFFSLPGKRSRRFCYALRRQAGRPRKHCQGTSPAQISTPTSPKPFHWICSRTSRTTSPPSWPPWKDAWSHSPPTSRRPKQTSTSPSPSSATARLHTARHPIRSGGNSTWPSSNNCSSTTATTCVASWQSPSTSS